MMDKNAQLSIGSPCEYCGLPSVQLLGTVPVCPRHLQQAQSHGGGQGAMPPRLIRPVDESRKLANPLRDRDFLRDARGYLIDEVTDKLGFDSP